MFWQKKKKVGHRTRETKLRIIIIQSINAVSRVPAGAALVWHYSQVQWLSLGFRGAFKAYRWV